MKLDFKPLSPAEFYRLRRPEYFSDSESQEEIAIPREVLSLEFSNISTNQKQDMFESLCRKLAEKFICPNLIPQVGPTGGGDGKTDTETHPVSKTIAEKWFIPKDGWDNDEKWAFAISAKTAWKGKVDSDVKKIVDTKRGYTKIYFISNQLISSKKKKDAQDAHFAQYGVETIILDAEWILERIYTNGLFALVADCLNLSDVYRNKKTKLGHNDTARIEELDSLEKDIASLDRYSQFDTQLANDAIRSAVLSRMLERPREEVEGKFARAERLCKSTNNQPAANKLIYQKAWTFINYYDDFDSFIIEFYKLLGLVNTDSTNAEIEWLVNLFNLYRPLHDNGEDKKLPNAKKYEGVEKSIIDLLTQRAQNTEKPCSALIARTYLSFFDLIDRDVEKRDAALSELSKIMEESPKYIEYPFESFYTILSEIGDVMCENPIYDELMDTVINIASARQSEKIAGEMFLKRGAQKIRAKKYKEGIIHFGKAIYRLAKEETQGGLKLALQGLSGCYEKLGLHWASYNCTLASSWIVIKKWCETKIITQEMFQTVKTLIGSELFLGRIPNILTWLELYLLLANQRDEEDDAKTPFPLLVDGCLSVRLLHTHDQENYPASLTELLDRFGLGVSSSTCSYLFGYIDTVMKDFDLKTEKELDDFFAVAYSAPFYTQMVCWYGVPRKRGIAYNDNHNRHKNNNKVLQKQGFNSNSRNYTGFF